MRVHSLASILLVTILAMTAAAQSAQTGRIEVSKLGPQVGERVPDFSLKDQNGKVWDLQSLMGPKGLMLVFVRSADWCPYCKTQLIDLQNRVEEIRGRGLGVAAISYDPQEVHAGFAKQHSITYTMLADVGSTTIRKFGILNPVPEWALGPDSTDPSIQAEVQKFVSVFRPQPNYVGIAFPGTFILDRQGRVTSRFFEDFYIERNTVSGILLRLDDKATPVTGTEISTAHFAMTTYPSDAAIAAGNRFSLALDFKPRPGMHIYAPGAQAYRAISLKLDPNPWLQALAMKYPPSEIYEFKPLKERVPVYQKPFTLVQELVLNGTPQAQAAYRGQESITITGSLEYQACDEAICFSPTSVPLTWTVKLRPLVSGRTNRIQ